MNYGLYLSASGMLTSLYRQDVFANNLANIQTVGFKRDLASIQQRAPEAIEDSLGLDVRKELLDKLGGGVLAGQQKISFTPGAMIRTENPLDVALEAPDQFFVVGVSNPRSGQVETKLTRDGRFSRNSQGVLVTVAGGHQVLDPNGQPIQIAGNRPIRINQAGQLLQDGQPIAQIQVAAVADLNRLTKEGQNLFRFSGQPNELRPAVLATVQPGFVEASGVDSIKALLELVEATKAATSNGNLIRYHDLLMDRAVNVLGRVG